MLRQNDGVTDIPSIQIETGLRLVQHIAPPKLHRFEGIAFSSLGNIIGVATSDTNSVFLFRRKPDGLFEDAPYSSISGPTSGLNYPHDLAFSQTGELLAVAQRAGSIAIYEKNKANDNYGHEPVFQIHGRQARLDFSDAVAFVPPNDNFLAACNLKTETISFYHKISVYPIAFKLKPVFELKHDSLGEPDGLAFSDCGTWLAVANHGNQTVSIFERRKSLLSREKPKYRRKPVTIIRDSGLRYPHSLAFTSTNHLVVTNAGANYFSIYEPRTHSSGVDWSQLSVLRQNVGPDDIFREVNARNKMEGGPKGVAIHKNIVAICSPEHGLKIYSSCNCF
jgi:hypothetical protein